MIIILSLVRLKNDNCFFFFLILELYLFIYLVLLIIELELGCSCNVAQLKVLNTKIAFQSQNCQLVTTLCIAYMHTFLELNFNLTCFKLPKA